jgi:hypothetical protein
MAPAGGAGGGGDPVASVTLSPVAALCGVAAAALAPLVQDEPGGLEHLARSIEQDDRTLWRVSIGSTPAGWVVSRVERYTPGGPEFWIVFAAGGDPRAPLAPSVLEALEIYARGLGCARVVFWTRRRGLASLAASRGYSANIVMRKAL